MSGWAPFALASAAFLLTHFVPTRPPVRARLIAAMGRRAWFTTYGLVSLAVTAWLIVAAGQAPFVELWPQRPWTRWLPNLALLAAILLACLGLPASTVTLGGPREPRLDPASPGFAAATRHPFLWALALWASAHLAPNGDLAHVLLFGGFALMALAAMPAFDARARRALGPAEARAYFGATATLSVVALGRPDAWRGAVPRLLVAGCIWVALLVLHPLIIGVSPLPV